MADHCMIIAGEWKISGDGSWNFSIDKHQMSRIVTLSPSMTLLELQNNVLKEFFPNKQTRQEASLSYWPPNSKELATGISTPLVILTHDASPSKPSNTTTSPHSAPSKIRRFSLIDETVLCSDEMLEEMFKADSDNLPDSWQIDAEEEEVSGPDSPLPPGFEEVQPRGYDHDFWDPLIAKHLGGSDAKQVIAGIDVPKMAPYSIYTETSPAEQPTNQKPDPEDPTSHHHSFSHVYPNPMDTRTPQSVPSQHRRYPYGQTATPSAGEQPPQNPHGQSTFTPGGTWIETYAGVIYPDAPIGDFPIPATINSVIMLPPQTRRPSGRPRDKRVASTGEIPTSVATYVEYPPIHMYT
ncbi:hypothetical protein HID58_034438 [Brassica napus]|uniref:Uncharacterized protein n=1 Tax=Brassica napus TaxID=3708 RepID=A0ABQ8C208_BRANA|nr:hypothetical protein HID58_034438 [Brassica napus]